MVSDFPQNKTADDQDNGNDQPAPEFLVIKEIGQSQRNRHPNKEADWNDQRDWIFLTTHAGNDRCNYRDDQNYQKGKDRQKWEGAEVGTRHSESHHQNYHYRNFHRFLRKMVGDRNKSLIAS